MGARSSGAGAPASRPTCRRARSSTAALSLVVVIRVVLDRAEQLDDSRLLAPGDVLLQGLGDGFLLGRTSADLQGLIQEAVVEREVGGHSHTAPHTSVCKAA